MRPFPALLLSCLLPFAPAVADAADMLPGPVEATVLKVVDGDTLAVSARVWLGQEVQTRVRLDGIDTPESRSKCAQEKAMAAEARRKLEELVRTGADQVRLVNVVDDKFGGRVRARVLLADGTDLSHALIASGLARSYNGGKRKPWCS
ncbi:thermonuclease family protein [Oleisolibacter albus]|uniref:thermonuclease family protein n=1 Tax=Oleisolibacter albus TaxID=2171757 RepID=UPI001EFE8D85|nr:thermonuclease family protein [Oleisolibacter albus]